MVAAIAAAALAAGQAQAGDNLELAGWASLSGNKTAGHASNTDLNQVNLTATADTPVVNNNEFTLTIKEANTHAINGNGKNKGGFTAEKGSLVIEGSAAVRCNCSKGWVVQQSKCDSEGCQRY